MKRQPPHWRTQYALDYQGAACNITNYSVLIANELFQKARGVRDE